MNERIVDDLVLKAREIAISDTKDGGKRFDLDLFHRKFAELIVRECAHLVGGYTKENEFGTDVKEAYEEITKHFGVEE